MTEMESNEFCLVQGRTIEFIKLKLKIFENVELGQNNARPSETRPN